MAVFGMGMRIANMLNYPKLTMNSGSPKLTEIFSETLPLRLNLPKWDSVYLQFGNAN